MIECVIQSLEAAVGYLGIAKGLTLIVRSADPESAFPSGIRGVFRQKALK
jgi:hypothetical protein